MSSKAQMPRGWRLVRLGDVLEICRNGLVCPQDATPEAGIPITRIETISNGTIDWKRVGYVTSEYDDPDYSVLPDDVLLSHINSVRHIGKVARKQDERPLIHGMNLIRLRFNRRIHPSYGFALLNWSQTKAYFERRAKKAVNQASINQQDIQELPLSLPPLSEQRAIAAVLDSIDDAIEGAEAVIAATGQLRDSLLHQLLTRGVPGQHTEWKDVPGLGAMPADWDVVRLGELVTHVGSGVTPRGGKSAYTASGITFLRSQNVHFDGLRLEDVVYVSPETDNAMTRSRVLPDDVLLNITGASIGRCTVAPGYLGPANVNQHVCIIRTAEEFNPRFVWKWLSTPRSQREIDDIQTGQSRQGLNYQQVRQLTIARPSRAEQDSIVEILNGLDDTVAEAKRERDGFQLLKESTADALLTGRVRVGEINE